MDNGTRTISDLESEIQYLKRLLDENGISYDYEAHLRALQSDVGDIVFPELGPEHASILYSYFKGRQDVYALRSSKKGYYTQCNNFWKYGICPKKDGVKIKCQDCPSKDYKELKGRVILQHLQGLKDRMQNAIRRVAAYSNPQFFQTLKLGFSTKDTPRIVYNGYDELISQLSGAGVCYDVVDKRQKGLKIDVHFNGELYPEQRIAAEKMSGNDIGVLAAATAFGKTVLGAYLIAQKKVNALVLVHNVEIMNNWIKDLSSFLTINEELPTYTTPKGRVKKRSSLIGTFSSQKDTTTGIIDIAMITSLGREDNINELVRNYGMVIVDECHHAAAWSYPS